MRSTYDNFAILREIPFTVLIVSNFNAKAKNFELSNESVKEHFILIFIYSSSLNCQAYGIVGSI